MGWFISREFLWFVVSTGIMLLFFMFIIAGVTDWSSSKKFERTYMGIALFLLVLSVFLIFTS